MPLFHLILFVGAGLILIAGVKVVLAAIRRLRHLTDW
jgi:hypothetical protein